PEGRRALLRADRGRHQLGRSREPGPPAAADAGRAVRDDPGVRGSGHGHLRGRQLRHRRTHHCRQGAGEGTEGRPEGRRQVQEVTDRPRGANRSRPEACPPTLLRMCEVSAPAAERASQPITPPRPRAKARWLKRAPMLPAMIFAIIVTQIAFAITIIISFMNWNAAYPDDIGFGTVDNYVTVFTDADLLRAVLVTVSLTVAVVLVSALLGLGIALLLDRKFIGRGFVRTLLITPFLVVPVAAALLFKHAILHPSYGLLGGLLTTVFGENAPQPDLMSSAPLVSIGLVLVWQWTPFMMLIMLAGLQSRPMDVYEAALVDGAGHWQT